MIRHIIQLFVLPIVLIVCSGPLYAGDERQATSHADSVATEYYFKSLQLGQSGEADSALLYLKLAIDTIDDKSKDFGLYPVLRMNQAVYLGAAGHLDSAIHSYQRILREISYLDTLSIHRIYRSMGVFYRQIYMTDSALFCYGKCLKLAESIKDPRLLSETCTNLAVLYHEMNVFENAEDMASRAYSLGISSEHPYTIMQAATVYAEIFARRLPYQELKPYLDKAVSYAQQLGAAEFMLRAIHVIMRTAPKEEVLRYIAVGDSIAGSFPPLNRTLIVYQFIKATKMYEYGRYATALETFRHIESLYTSGKLESEQYYCETLQMLGKIYYATGNYRLSTEYRDKAIKVADKLHNESISRLVSENAVKNEMNLKEIKIASLERENRMQNKMNIYLFITAAVLCLLVIMFFVYFSLRSKKIRNEAELRNVRSYIDGLEHERSRLAKDLHDGVCSDLLGIGYAIQSLGNDSKSIDRIAELVEDVRKDVRYISHKLMPPRFRNLTLNQAMDSYISQISEISGITISYKGMIPDSELSGISENTNYNLYRIVQELISNSLKHSKASEIELIFSGGKSSGYRMEYRQFEDCPYKDGTESGRGSGIGMDTINERIICIGASSSVVEGNGFWSFIIEFRQ